MDVLKKLMKPLTSFKLYSVIYIDETGNCRAKVCQTELSKNIALKKLRSEGYKIIEEKILVKNVEQNKEYNLSDEDIMDVKNDFKGIENAKNVSDVEKIIKSRGEN